LFTLLAIFVACLGLFGLASFMTIQRTKVPYRIEISPLLFVLAGFGVVMIAFLSVGFQTLKSALINPADTLKYE